MATFFGTNGNDNLMGTSATDWIHGLAGNDMLQGMGGADYLSGGAGNDTAIYLDSLEGVWINLAAGTGDLGSAEGDVLVSIENVEGSAFADMLMGDNNANFLHGWGGNDTLKGGGGADTLHGGPGSDTASYVNSSAGVTVSLFTGLGSGGEAEGDELMFIENLMGSDYADNLWGSNGANVLHGESGNDTLKGFGGADTLWGGANDDELSGMDGQDTLNGGMGNDWLNGGAHADVLNGGTGADVFYFYEASDTSVAAPDQITDMNENAGDKINLSHIDANVNVAGNQAFVWIGNNNVFTGAAGELSLHGDYVEGDVDGDAVADFRIQINLDELHDYAFIL